MGKVVPKPLSEYFISKDIHSREKHYFPKLYKYSQSINPLTMSVALCVFFFLIGFGNVFAMALALSIAAFLGITYFQLKKSAENIHIERDIHKTTLIEFENIEINLNIVNSGSMHTVPLEIFDQFTPSIHESVHLGLEVGLPPAHKRRLQYKRNCDGGAGKKEIGPLVVRLKDPLGLFQFDVVNDEKLEIEILPKFEDTGEVHTKGSSMTNLYGTNEIPIGGSSISFKGIREYARGDSLRHISWKISAKRKKLFVKEFDLMTNSQVYVALNLNPEIHIGSKNISTWEYSHDIALGILKQQMESGNIIQFITNNPMNNLNLDDFPFEVMAKKLVTLRPSPSFEGAELDPSKELFLKDYFSTVESGASLFYISPYTDGDKSETIDCLKKYRTLGVDVYCIFLETTSFFTLLSEKIDSRFHLARPSSLELKQTIHELECYEIKTYLVCANNKLSGIFSEKTASSSV